MLVPFFTLLFHWIVLAQVQSLETSPYKAHPKGAKIHFLTSQLAMKPKAAFVGHLTIPADGKVPLHQDGSEEFLFILSGVGTIQINGQRLTIKKNDLVFMPAKASVSFENGPQELRALQFFAPGDSAEKYDHSVWGPLKR